MTAEPLDDDIQPTRIVASESDRDTSQDRFPFYLGDDDEILYGTRPKMAVLIELVAGMNDESNPIAQAATFSTFLDRVLAPESATYIRARMSDPEDYLDLDHPEILQMFKTLVEIWYGVRPTGGRRGSAPSPSRTGRASTVKRRS